jgi:hypothetical protein
MDSGNLQFSGRIFVPVYQRSALPLWCFQPKAIGRRTPDDGRTPPVMESAGCMKTYPPTSAKVSGTHHYQVTANGRRILTALLAARQADVDQLTQIAA